MKGLCLDEESVDARSNITSVLATWSGMVAEERKITKPGGREVVGLAAFITHHLDWLLAQPTAPYFADEVMTITAAARRVSQPGSARRPPLGFCVEKGCDASLHVAGTATDARSSAQVRCENGHTWQAHEWLVLASGMRDREKSAAAAMRETDAQETDA